MEGKWKRVPLGEAVEFLDSQRRPIKVSDRAQIRGPIPYYGASGVIDYVNQFLFNEELILLGEDGENILSRSLPLAFKISGKSWVNNHAHVLKPRSGFDTDYVVIYLESLDYSGLNSGTAQPKLNKQTCLAIEIYKPNIAEQKAIAQTLTDTDDLISTLERLLAKKQAIKQAMMQQLLTGRTRLPGFSGEVEDSNLSSIKSRNFKANPLASLGELEKQGLIKLFRGQVISKHDIFSTPGPYPIYSSSIQNNGLFGYYGQFMFDEELITWSVDGGGNFFYRSKHKFSVTNVCGYLRVLTNKVDARYLAFSLQAQHARLKFDYTLKAHPSIIKSAYSFSLPSIAEQKAIAQVLADADDEIEALQMRLVKAREIKQGMMQQLLTGRTRLPVGEDS